MKQKLSAASIRAKNYDKGPEWYCVIREHEITGDLSFMESVFWGKNKGRLQSTA